MSAIFDHIAALQGERAWGRVLDAGTGINSLRWLRTLPADSLTAVTGADLMVRRMHEALGPSPQNERILVGDWADPAFLAGETFDVVLADYLIGAIEGFAPYFQDAMMERLRAACTGRLYLVGLEPYVLDRPTSPQGEIIYRIGRLRDTFLLLSGQKTYREFPLDWITRHLERVGFRIVDIRKFPIRYRARFVNAQLDMCVNRLHLIPQDLRQSLAWHVEELRREALRAEAEHEGLRLGFDYVVTAEPD